MPHKTLICRDCACEFAFTAGEQEFFNERGFADPKRCKPCREQRKAELADAPSPRSKPTTRGSR